MCLRGRELSIRPMGGTAVISIGDYKLHSSTFLFYAALE